MRLILAILLALPLAAHAASTCPIGGGAVTLPSPETCEETTQRTMSLAPANGCTTRFAQCNENFLPLYKDFTEAELELASQYLQMEAYESAVDSSPYFLAYNLERFLGGDPNLPFQLLLQGLWYDAPRSYSDPVYMDNFFFEAGSAFNSAPSEELAALHALVAFAYIQTENIDSARQHLAKSLALGPATVIVTGYQLAVAECLEDSASLYCDPNTLSPVK